MTHQLHPCQSSHLSAGVARISQLDAGLVLPLPDATTPTLYCVPGRRPLNVAAGVALVTTTAEPALRGVAVKVNASQGPPDVGGVAVAVPWVGPVASAAVRVAAAGGGMVMEAGAEGGVAAPAAGEATTKTL